MNFKLAWLPGAALGNIGPRWHHGQYFLVRLSRLASKRLKKGMVVLVAVAVLVE